MTNSSDLDIIVKKIAAELKKDELCIPSMPELVLKLSSQVNNTCLSVKDLANLISSDTSVSSQVVRLSQTLRYSNPGTTVTTLPNAISRIGLSSSTSIALALAIEQNFEFKNSYLSDYSKKQFLLSRKLCKLALQMCTIKYIKIQPLIIDYIILASALLNIGVLPFIGELDIFYRNHHDLHENDYAEIERYINKIKLPLGIAILRHWKFDKSFERVITLEIDMANEFYTNSFAYAQSFIEYAKEQDISIDQPIDFLSSITIDKNDSILVNIENWMKNNNFLPS